MSNPILPAPPSGSGSVDGAVADYDSGLPLNNEAIDEGKTTDDHEKVQEDVIEADVVRAALDG